MSWWERAACRDLARDVFFPGENETHQYVEARRICAGCPVRDECLDDALATGERFGMRGGLTPREREQLRSGQRGRLGPGAVARCGTNAGYHRHVREHNPPCGLCRAAHAAYAREYEHRRRVG